SKDEIDRMVRDAEQYAEEDARRREAVDTRNQADGLVYNTEKFIADNADKLPDDVKTEAFTAAITKLGESSQKMGAAMYANAEAQAGATGEASQQAPAEDDADVV